MHFALSRSVASVALRRCAAASMIVIVAQALPVHAQDGSSEISEISGVSDTTVQTMTAQLIAEMPSFSPLVVRPSVDVVGTMSRTDGALVHVPVTAVHGLVDVLEYTSSLEESLFSNSSAAYPHDSLVAIERARAQGWVDRLTSVPARDAATLTQGRQLLPLAQLAWRAGQDTLAERLFDARVRQLAEHPAEQAAALYWAVVNFANRDQDSARLAKNVRVADRYLKQLLQIPLNGYRTHRDSEHVLQSQFVAEDSVIGAYQALGDTATMFQRCRAFFRYTNYYVNPDDALSFAMMHAVTIGTMSEEGRTQARAFWPVLMAAVRRMRPERVKTFEEYIQTAEKKWALLNTPAPSVVAHAWLNTPDSLYAPTPRRHGFGDGRLHVLVYSMGGSGDAIARLERIRTKYGDTVGALLVTGRLGFIGPDVADAPDDVAYLTRYFRGVLHTTVPVAIWGGNWTGTIAAGTFTLDRGPNVAIAGSEECILVDTTGRIALILPFKTRADERVLWRELDRRIRGVVKS